jgi:hypothetical protein
MVFVDTGAWFAWHVREDPAHALIRQWVQTNRFPLVTTDYCVDETFDVARCPQTARLALDAGRNFFHNSIAQIHFITPSQVNRAWILFQQRGVAGWSFTDCTSKVVIEDLQVRTALALDDHFRQFGDVAVVP